MKSTLRTWLVLTLLLLTARTYAQQASFSIVITSAQSSVQSGYPIHLHVVLTSTAKVDFSLPQVVHTGQAELNYPVTVSDSNGRPMPDSEYGHQVKNHSIIIISMILKTLRPGDSLKEDMDVNKLFDLTKPGTYTVYLERKDPLNSGSSIKSNTLAIHITPSS